MVHTRSEDELLVRICGCAVAHGGFILAGIGWLNADTLEITHNASAGKPEGYLQNQKSHLDDKQSIASTAVRTGRPAIWNDLMASPNEPWYAAAQKAGFRSAVAVPIRLVNGRQGALTVYADEVNFFCEQEIDLLSRIAADIAVGLDYLDRETKREAELAYERDLLRAMMDHSPDHIYFKDLDSRFIRCSRSMCDQFGATPEDIIGKCDSDYFGSEHANDALEDERRIIATGKPLVGKIEKETWKEGKETWVLTAKLPLHDRNNKIIGTLGISKDFTAIKQAEAKMEQLNRQLVEASRMAGMAEVATSVLHNVGNVLNSVNISSSLITDKIRSSKVQNLGKVATLLQEQSGDLVGFFNNKGKQLPGYLADLSKHLSNERDELLRELESLAKNVEHIKEIVAMQQSYARVAGVKESVKMSELLEDAIRLNRGAIERHHVNLVREFSEVPLVLVDKHKVVQILVNLIQNAKFALNETEGLQDKRVVLRIEKGNDPAGGVGTVRVLVSDNGCGIKPENLPRIFEHGFTTRKTGHGFGLHSGALAAKELGGSLAAQSAGPGQGATFILEVPCDPNPTTL